MAEKVLGVLVSGRGSNLQAIIENIRVGSLPVRIGVVISDNEAAYALERARAAGINTSVLERGAFSDKKSFETALSDELSAHKVDLVVLAGFMRILGTDFLRHWSFRVMNIHPSLLPSFPGLHPQRQALAYGAKVSGCTVHFVDEGVDTGPVIMQKTVPVLCDDTEDTLAERILEKEHQAYSEAIGLWAAGQLSLVGRMVVVKIARSKEK